MPLENETEYIYFTELLAANIIGIAMFLTYVCRFIIFIDEQTNIFPAIDTVLRCALVQSIVTAKHYINNFVLHSSFR